MGAARGERQLHGGLPLGGSEAYVRKVIPLMMLARVAVILLLAAFAILFVIGIVSSETGAIEKVALLALIAACVVLAARVTTVAAHAHRRLQRH